MLLTLVITAPMMAIGGVLLSLSQDTALARVLIAVIPILGVIFFLIMRKAVPLFQLMQVKIDRLNLVLDEGPDRRARDPRVRSQRAPEPAVRRREFRPDPQCDRRQPPRSRC